MGFIQQLLQNQQQGQTSPQQSAQSRFGQSGMLESLRSLQPPSMPTNRQASQGGSAPFGGFLGNAGGSISGGGGIQQILEALRNQMGQQGLGSGMFGQGGHHGGGGAFPGSSIPQINPRPPMGGGIQMPQMPNFPKPPSSGGLWNPQLPQSGPSMAPSTPMVNPQMPRPQIPSGSIPSMPTHGDPRPPSLPTQPSAPTQTQSRYGSLSGVRRPGSIR